jgi:hypothetical protein
VTTLSLFDDQAALDRPAPPARLAQRVQPAQPDRPGRGGGLTLPVLALAALVASPAIWQCLVRHALPVQVMLERYVVIAVGCLLISEVARRLLRSGAPAEPAAEAAGTTDDPALALLATED